MSQEIPVGFKTSLLILSLFLFLSDIEIGISISDEKFQNLKMVTIPLKQVGEK